MTIDEAIERLTEELDDENIPSQSTTALAIYLGIEALKKWKVLREGRAGIIDPLLPGETE